MGSEEPRHRLAALDVLMQDVRYAFRTMRRDRAFALIAVLILGLGSAGCRIHSGPTSCAH